MHGSKNQFVSPPQKTKEKLNTIYAIYILYNTIYI